MSVPTTPPVWWEGLDPFDAACHIASRIDSLLAGVEDGETLEECQDVAANWMRDLAAIREDVARKVARL